MESSAAELISAMAGGWKAKLIVEAWSNGGYASKNSIGLAIAAHHSGGRHVCIVADEKSRQEYIRAMQSSPAGVSLPEVMVGKPEELMERLIGIDFLVVDIRCEDYSRVFNLARFSRLGAVLICRNDSITGKRTFSGFRWKRVLDSAVTIVRSSILPIGNGVDIAYIAGENLSSRKLGTKRWFRHVDKQSGEEHVFRR